MISNPGQSVSPTVMQTSVYDINNKKQDIFQYTDSKVSDKVTSAQVASQISSATANFVTSSQVDAKITAHKNDPYMWQSLWIVPYTGTMFSSWSNKNYTSQYTTGGNNYTDYYYLLPLPVSMKCNSYQYEIVISYYGLSTVFHSLSSSSANKVQLCRTLPSSTSDTYKGEDITLTPTENVGTTLDWPYYAKYQEVRSASKIVHFTEGFNLTVNNTAASGYTFKNISTTAGDAYTYTHVGFELGFIRNSSTYTMDIQTFGMKFSYRAIR